jgi:hypothetical protein
MGTPRGDGSQVNEGEVIADKWFLVNWISRIIRELVHIYVL